MTLPASVFECLLVFRSGVNQHVAGQKRDAATEALDLLAL